MYSIKKRTSVEIEEKKSRFIGIAIPVDSETSVKNSLLELRKEFPKATHYTYAYILGDSGNIQKASDDGEPTRTAGYPILEIILKNNLTNVLLVVIRYFGGIKLGAGGLIRAYSGCASDTVADCQLTSRRTALICKLVTDYDHIGNIDRFLRENTILLDVEYDSSITFTFKIDEEALEFTREDLFNKNNFEDHLEIVEKLTEYR